MTTLPGGWIADRLIGQRRAVLYGGILIAVRPLQHGRSRRSRRSTSACSSSSSAPGCSRATSASSSASSTRRATSRRDAGFSIFYMGINLGAFIAPLVCGYLGQRVNWHLGFAAAGVGMVLGLIQYVLGAQVPRRRRPAPGDRRRRPKRRAPEAQRGAAGAVVVGARSLVVVGIGAYTGVVAGHADADRRRRRLPAARSSPSCSSAGCSSAGDWTPEERKRLLRHRRALPRAPRCSGRVFEQAGSTLNLFADRDTRNVDPRLELPEQLVPVAELAVHHRSFAPVFAWLWLAARRRGEPSSPVEVRARPDPASAPASRSWSSAAQLARAAASRSARCG